MMWMSMTRWMAVGSGPTRASSHSLVVWRRLISVSCWTRKIHWPEGGCAWFAGPCVLILTKALVDDGMSVVS